MKPMRALFIVLFVPLGLTVPSLLRAAEAKEARYLSFSVKGEHDFYLRDLELEEIELRLDDEPVEIRYLGSSGVSTSFAFILENSPRTAMYPVSRPRMGQINPIDHIRYNMLFDFFRPLTEKGPVLLAQFFEEVEVLQDFTEYDASLTMAMNDLQPEFAGIVMNQIEVGRAVGRGVDLLRNRPERRKVLVLFTTTVDRESYQNLEEYQLMLRNTDIDLFVLSFAPRTALGSTYSFEEKMNTFFFRRLVSETSGWAYISGEYVYVDEFMTDLKARLGHSYTVGFYVEPEDEVAEHEIEIKVSRKKSEVTHRKFLVY